MSGIETRGAEPDPELPLSTGGIVVRTRRRWLAELLELLSSMRFAISLLALIAIAATIGTVLKQNEAMPNYVNQFGPFWFEVFARLGLYALYSNWWFLLIMLLLVLSTSLCIVRNTPKMLRDMRSWRLNVREQSLRNFHHHHAWHSPLARQALAERLAAQVGQAGYRTRIVEKDGATLLAARHGSANKFGYIFAHTAIVVICLGGMLDSELPLRVQQWVLGKTPYAGGGLIDAIPAQHRLGLGNPSYRGNTLIAEGASSHTAILQQADGVLIQELPFSISLKRFNIDFYSTGMPKLFASDVTITDRDTGHHFDATIKVNEPLIYRGIALYQASFEDGGSKLGLTAYPMAGAQGTPFALAGEVGASTPLGQGDYTVEWTGFRPFNVENTSGDARAVRQPDGLGAQFAAGLDKQLGSAGKHADNKDLKNVGPTVQYKLRDQAGQAREFQNYMLPLVLDGTEVFLVGVRESPADAFSYLRIPADDSHGLGEWMRLRAALQQPALRQRAAQRYAARALAVDSEPGLRMQIEQSARKGLEVFAGVGSEGGYRAVAAILARVPPPEQEKTADIFMKILNGTLWDLWQVAREQDKLPALPPDDRHGAFLQVATNALSDAFIYRAPVLLELAQFEQVKASVLQVTRSPGKKIVYLGCLLLVLGVFAMFYIRERRLWIWLRDDGAGCAAILAMSAQRKTLDFEKEYTDMVAQLAPGETPPPGRAG